MPVTAAALPLAPSNGRSSPAHAKPAPIRRPAAISTRWRWISIAAALLILLDRSQRLVHLRARWRQHPGIAGSHPGHSGNPHRRLADVPRQPGPHWIDPRAMASSGNRKSPGPSRRTDPPTAPPQWLPVLPISAVRWLLSMRSMPRPVREQWRFTGDSALESTPTVADGTVYITSDNGTFYAIDAEDGRAALAIRAGDHPELLCDCVRYDRGRGG